MSQVIAVANQKGGVGKSTTAAHLARAAVLAGRRVLLVDMDPQGNTTQALAAEEYQPGDLGLADVLSPRAGVPLREAITPSVWDRLSLVPSSGMVLGAVRDELVAMPMGREARLREALRAVADDYDVVLLDLAPSADQLVVNALAAADAIVIVTEAELWSTNGLVDLMSSIEQARLYYNQRLLLAGILVNKVPSRSREAAEAMAELTAAAESQGWPLMSPVIPRWAVIGSSVKAGQGLDQVHGRDADYAEQAAAKYADLFTQITRTIEGATR